MDDLDLPPEMRRALDALDARAKRQAAGVDAGRVAARVLGRLRSGEAVPASGRGLARGLRVAASVALLVVAGSVATRLIGRDPMIAGGAALPLSGADSLTAVQADSLVQAIDDVRALNTVVPGASVTVGVDELNARELRALLQALQSSEGET